MVVPISAIIHRRMYSLHTVLNTVYVALPPSFSLFFMHMTMPTLLDIQQPYARFLMNLLPPVVAIILE